MSETHHTVDPKFTYRDKRSGKDVVLYVGLLDAAHRAGLVDVTPVVLQFPHDDNAQTCIVMATARFTDGRSFSSIGDANPKNVGPNIVPHFIRMAETRAKARALRDALNVGMVTLEELGGAEDDDGNAAAAPAPPRRDVAPRPDRHAHDRPETAQTQPAAPAPLSAAAFAAASEGAWTAYEDGEPYETAVMELNKVRGRFSEEQRAVALNDVSKLREAYADRDAALAPVAPSFASAAGAA